MSLQPTEAILTHHEFPPETGRKGDRSRKIQWTVNIIIALVLFTFSFMVNNDHVETTELHPDETRWLNRAHYLEDFLDPFGPTWQDYYLTRGQPPGGSYLMGLGLILQGQPTDSVGVWDFNYGVSWTRDVDTTWNQLAGATPSEEVLIAGRRTNVVVGALVVVLAFAVTSMLTNRFGGVVAGLFLAYHPLHITLSTQALSDELLALMLGVAFVAAFQYARRPGIGWALLLGIAIGIGAGTKLAPMALSFVLAGYGLVWLAWMLRQHGRSYLSWSSSRFAWLLILQPIISGITFVAMYPYLWVSPIGNSLHVLDFRRQEMASQARIWTHASVDGPIGAFKRYGEQLHGAYSSTRDAQISIADQLGFTIDNPISFDLIFVAIGAILLTRIVIQRGLWSPHTLVATLMAAEVGAVTVGLGVDFYRYYLPVLLVNSVLVGIVFGEIADMIRRVFRPESAPSEDEVDHGELQGPGNISIEGSR
jgi:hypothetical protein